MADFFLQALGAIGGAGLIVLALSGWLGKVWADRALAGDRTRHESEIERLKTELRSQSDRMLAEVETALAIYRDKHVATHRDKLELYRALADALIGLVVDIQFGKITRDSMEAFDRRRLRIHMELGVFAPQEVLDAYDAMVDYLYGCLEGSAVPSWPAVRDRGFELMNRIRADIGMSPGRVEYRGSR
jgi:hypothetical protein